MAEQLIKRDSQRGYRNVFPKTYLDAVKDRESGKSLEEILQGLNMHFLSYVGDKGETRVQLPKSLRRRGIWITYVLWDDTIVVEFYNGDSIEDNEFRKDSNWMIGSNRLIGDIMVSSEGNWVINGKDTGLPAKGETGIAPIIRIVDNKLQVSYDKGETWEALDNNNIITQFRVNENRLEVSYDLGKNWSICSEYIASWLRVNNNKLEISRDEQKTWQVVSDYLAVYIKTEGNKLWISRDNIRWEEASDYIATYFRIENNKLQSSIDKENWKDESDFIAAWFRIEGNKLQMSRDEQTWVTMSDYIATYFRNEGNKLQMSNDKETWDDCSDYIAAWFRWSEDNRIQISRTNVDGSWQNMSPIFADNVYIRGYLSSIDKAPADSPVGAIYMVGPNEDGHYEMFINTSDGWVNNGAFTAVPIGVVQELGQSTTEVMSQKAVTDEFNKIQRVFDGGSATTKYGGARVINAGNAFGNT